MFNHSIKHCLIVAVEKSDNIFTMRREGTFKKPLARQIREGVEIELSRGILMNSKSEWNNPKIPRIVIESGEEQIEDQESGLGKKGESVPRISSACIVI